MPGGSNTGGVGVTPPNRKNSAVCRTMKSRCRPIMISKNRVIHVFQCPRPSRECRGPAAKEKDEAPCESEASRKLLGPRYKGWKIVAGLLYEALQTLKHLVLRDPLYREALEHDFPPASAYYGVE